MTTRIDQFSPGAGEVNTWIVGGFADQLTAIGENLLTLPGRTQVLPGHGPQTTVEAAEKRFDSWVSAGPVASGLGD